MSDLRFEFANGVVCFHDSGPVEVHHYDASGHQTCWSVQINPDTGKWIVIKALNDDQVREHMSAAVTKLLG